MRSLEDMCRMAAAREKTAVAVAAAQDEHVLEAADAACKRGLARFFFVGDEAMIRNKADALGIDAGTLDIIHEEDPAKACATAVRLVSEGRAGALMKGRVDTGAIMRAALNKDAGLRTGRKLTHLAAFQLPAYPKLLFITDAAVNIAPDLATKKDIVWNAIQAVRKIGYEMPKIALLAAKEKVDEHMPVTVDWDAIVRWATAEGLPAVVEGPLSLDIAVSREAAAVKGMISHVSGDADILVAPEIETGNVLYKTLIQFGGGTSGGVVLGAKAPIILSSRSDSAESKLASIALGILTAG